MPAQPIVHVCVLVYRLRDQDRSIVEIDSALAGERGPSPVKGARQFAYPGLADRCGEPMRNRYDDEHRETDDRRTAALMGLAVVLSLAIAGVVLVRDLGKESRLEDCLMSGRTNCAPIDLPPAP